MEKEQLDKELENLRKVWLHFIERKSFVVTQHNEGFVGETKSMVLYRSDAKEAVNSIIDEVTKFFHYDPNQQEREPIEVDTSKNSAVNVGYKELLQNRITFYEKHLVHLKKNFHNVDRAFYDEEVNAINLLLMELKTLMSKK